MNIIILGPQASGKGTQARMIKEEYNLYHLESGALLRELSVKNETVKKTLNSGTLVPDNELIALLTSQLEKIGQTDNIIFDGSPRTTQQLHKIQDWLENNGKKIDLAILLNLSEKETIRRLSARRIHKKTGKIYNLITNPPGKDINPEDLDQREDDKKDAILERLSTYRNKTEQVVKELKKLNILVQVDGKKPIEEIFREIKKHINRLK